MNSCSIRLRRSNIAVSSALFASSSSRRSVKKLCSISFNSSSNASCRSWNCWPMYVSRFSMSSACRFRALTYSSSFALSSFFTSAIKRSLLAVILSQAFLCFSISSYKSCGTSTEKRSAQRIATVALRRALCSASARSFPRSSWRRASSSMRRLFSRSSLVTRIEVTCSSLVDLTLNSRLRLSRICCLLFPISLFSSSATFLPPSPSPWRWASMRRCILWRRARIRVSGSLEFSWALRSASIIIMAATYCKRELLSNGLVDYF
mmetsp:Transcript_13305/g.28251  ORF Transcript_13305/g.28251 Transcript_13305/m.28251 type:complete len:263 (+) Transcript_13305:1631-2419(+)